MLSVRRVHANVTVFALSKVSSRGDIDDGDFQVPRLRPALEAEAHLVSDANLLDLVGKVRKPVHLLAVSRGDDIAEFTSRDR